MNREFRVWCKNKNEWEKDKIVIGQAGALYQYLPNTLTLLNEENHIIEFYTGLNDRYDNKIYEGDIVKTRICFGPGGSSLRTITVAYNRLGEISIQLWVYNEGKAYWPEVIGNIHEHDYLLKKKPYKDGTPLYHIIKDGWARGFEASKTLEEAKIMGYTDIKKQVILDMWKNLSEVME